MTDITALADALDRYAKDQWGWVTIDDTCEAAATALRELQAENERLRKLVDEENIEWMKPETIDRLQDAEANLAKAVEALKAHEKADNLGDEQAETIDRFATEGWDSPTAESHVNGATKRWTEAIEQARNLRRAFLAEIDAGTVEHPDSVRRPAWQDVWPFGCPKNSSCARHRQCMYGCAAHKDRPVSDVAIEIDDETKRRAALGGTNGK